MADQQPTWQPDTVHGKLSSSERGDLPDSVFAFPKQRKEPLTDATHVLSALGHFYQVTGVSDDDRELAFKNIKKAAQFYGLDVHEKSWRELGHHHRYPGEPGAQPRVSASTLQHYLKGANYPLSKADMETLAKNNNAPEHIIAAIRQLPQNEFRGVIDVEKAFSREH